MKLRAHELLHDVPLYDVSVVDLPGGGTGRTVADVRALDSAAVPSRIASVLYGLRYFLGHIFGWDRRRMQLEESLLPRLSDRDRRDSEVIPGTPDGPCLVLAGKSFASDRIGDYGMIGDCRTAAART